MKRFSELSIPVCLPTLVPPRLPDRQAWPANRAADPADAPAAQALPGGMRRRSEHADG